MSAFKRIRFCTFLCNAVMLADFQADGRWPSPNANDRVKEDVQGQQNWFVGHSWWTCELVQMQSQSQELPETSPLSQVQNTHSPGSVRCDWKGWVPRTRSWGHNIWNQTHNWGIQPSHEQSRLWCHLKRGKGIDGWWKSWENDETKIKFCFSFLIFLSSYLPFLFIYFCFFWGG